MQALASAAAVVFESDATRDLYSRLRRPAALRHRAVRRRHRRDRAQRRVVSPTTARRRLGLPLDATILLCLGTVEPRKGQSLLAEAFGVVAGEHPKAMLALVGAGSNRSSDALSQYVSKSGLADRVRIVPVTPDANLWYRAADALVCASDIESLPRTVIEAMAFSIPVIATRIFGLPELIDDGVTGYLYEPRDLGALIDVLIDSSTRALTNAGPWARRATPVFACATTRRVMRRPIIHFLSSLLADPKLLPGDVLP